MDNFNKEMQYQVDAVYEELSKLYENGDIEDEDGETYGVAEWFSFEVLDNEYTFSSNMEYLGARIYVTLGGPTVYVDTRNREIVCHWGTETVKRWCPSEFCDMLDEYIEECIEFNFQ